MNNSDTSASTGGGSSQQQQQGQRRSMTDREEKERRASIQAIMRDTGLTPQERRKSIQSLMDGRRRSSVVGTSPAQNGASGTDHRASGMGMAAAAAMAAAEFEDSSEDDSDDDGGMMHDDSDTNLHRKSAGDGNKREAKKRSSFTFKRSSSKLEEKQNRRRSGLRESFTAGFSRMGMKRNDSAEEGKRPQLSQSICLPAAPNALSRKMEQSRPPCQHYERHCSIVSPCCGLVFGCRICHDEAPELPPPFLLTGEGHNTGFAAASTSPFAAGGGSHPPITHRSASLPPNFTEEESHHEIDRFLIKEVICRECFTRQSSKTNNCIACGISFGSYHCSICNLWMTADEDPYHCIKCGFCRVGGRENFTHCDDCGMCIDALLFEDHNCKSGKYMSNCPVCQEDLFSSRMASHEMPCGHAIHWHCFRELTSHDTRCPVCKKTAETHDQMEQTWSAMAMGIALQPVPADMARVVDILCNDCEGKSENQRWHFLGVQCRQCTSFNTTVERTVLVGQEAADFLGPMGDVAAQAQWASQGTDQNVLAALMGGGAAAAAASMPPPGAEDDGMDTEALNQSVAAEVMGLMNRSNQPQQSGSRDEGDEMDQS